MLKLTQSQTREALLRLSSNKVPASVILWGESGIGKTAMTKSVAEELGIGYVCVHLAAQPEEEVTGIADPGLVSAMYDIGGLISGKNTNLTKKLDELQKKGYVDFLLPKYWKQIDGLDRGILMTDEFNRTVRFVQQAFMSVFEPDKRMLRDHKLPDGWLVVSGCNPPNGNYAVEELDPAMTRRTYQLFVEYDHDSFIEFSEKKKWPKTFTGFARVCKEHICRAPAEGEWNPNIFPTPAGWEELVKLEQYGVINSETLVSDVVGKAFVAGKVGDTACLAYVQYQQEHFTRPVSGEELLRTPGFSDKNLQLRILEQQEQRAEHMSVTTQDALRVIRALEKEDDTEAIIGIVTNSLIPYLLSDKITDVNKFALLTVFVDKGSEFSVTTKELVKKKELMDLLSKTYSKLMK